MLCAKSDMETFLTIHLVGAALAIVLNMSVVSKNRARLDPLWKYHSALANAAIPKGIKFDYRNRQMFSMETGDQQQIFPAIERIPLLSFPAFLQSILLGWLNVLIVGFALLASGSVQFPEAEMLELERETAQLSNGSFELEELKEKLRYCSTNGVKRLPAHHQAEIASFIDTHLK